MTVATQADAARVAFDGLLRAARVLMHAHPALTAFNGPLPDAPYVPRDPHAIPAVPRLLTDFGPDALHKENAAFLDAVRAVSPFAEWRRSYDAAQVGADFLARYGWFEMLGPEGHFHCATARAYVGYWGRDLYYPWHRHEAEEIYYCVAGGAVFEAEGDPVLRMSEGRTKVHSSDQMHAMTTQDAPVLTFVLWRGAGLAGKPAIPK